jgi:hypothetical protein
LNLRLLLIWNRIAADEMTVQYVPRPKRQADSCLGHWLLAVVAGEARHEPIIGVEHAGIGEVTGLANHWDAPVALDWRTLDLLHAASSP